MGHFSPLLSLPDSTPAANVYTGDMLHAHRWLLTRDFAFMWWSQVLSQVAEGISKLALLWFVYAVTGSPLKTTVIGLCRPYRRFSSTVHRRHRRSSSEKAILIVSDVARGLLIGLIPCLVSIEHFTVEALYVLTFLFGVATAVFVRRCPPPCPLWWLVRSSRRRTRSCRARRVWGSSSGRLSVESVSRSPGHRMCSA